MHLFFEVALFLTPQVGNKTFRILINHFKSAEKVFQASLNELAMAPGLRKDAANNILNKISFKIAEKNIKDTLKSNGKILYYQSSEFPQRLLRINDFPPLLFYLGNADLNPSKAISIVGTRQITNYGKELVNNIIEDLSSYNPQIISGLALGVDFNSHQKALNRNLDTIAVMATGLNKIYPSNHQNLSQKIQQQGGLLTEYPFDSKPDAMKFPARNRIIAGLSDAVIVVEAAKKGGALITAQFGNQYNIDVLACPGRVNDNFNQGCNQLIANHQANIYTSIDSVVNLLNWDNTVQTKKVEPIQIKHKSETHSLVYNCIGSEKEINSIDLSKNLNLDRGTLATILLELELDKYINQKAGGYYSIT